MAATTLGDHKYAVRSVTATFRWASITHQVWIRNHNS